MVVVIMGVLAGIVVFAVQNLGGTSVLAACQSDFKSVETAVESYKVQMGNYPDGTGGVGSVPPVTDGDSSQAGIVNAVGVEQGTTTLLSGQQLGSELLTGSENGATSHDFQGRQTLNRAMNPSVGPWLKDLPQNGSYYYIWVSNDGRGTILVGKGSLGLQRTAQRHQYLLFGRRHRQLMDSMRHLSTSRSWRAVGYLVRPL